MRSCCVGGAAGLLGALLPVPAWAASPVDQTVAVVAAAIAVGAIALAAAAGLWALAEQYDAHRLRRLLHAADARSRAAAGARDALIAASREPVIVWGRDGSPAQSYGGADALLDSCLEGPDAMELAKALDALSEQGGAFATNARGKDGRVIALRGRAVGALAAVWLSPEAKPEAATSSLDFRAMLDALPVPVWLRDRTLNLIWGNRAFLTGAGASDLESAALRQLSLERSERDLAAAARSEQHPTEAKRFAVIAGQRRALAFTHAPLEDGKIVGAAVDVTDVSNAEAKLQQHIDAHADTLDKLATAVAIFDSDQKLSFYNRAFVELWGLAEKWLDVRPTDGEVLDRLREARKLPEQRDYQTWKRQRLALYVEQDYLPEDLWHLPGGKTLRVVAQPHPFGGLTFLYEDVTERLALESSYNTLIKVQSATLDTLQEGVAVFGPDARLKLHNAAFMRIWELEPQELAGEPHIQKIAEISVTRFGDKPMWDRLVASIASGAERPRDWGEIERSDKTVLALSLAPLPDGATLATFADVTDRFRIETALRDRNEALETADRLKSDFVQHASFLFRDPLNAVQGFAEMLSGGHAGALTERQKEYVENILAASNNLAEVTSDILDLALIDSGALRLELARVDLFDLLTRVAEPLRKHAESLDIEFALDCAEHIGIVVVDPRRIRQIVFNLLSNAFKYTPRGGRIVLGGRIEGDDVQIFVSDTGPGMAPEVKANAFERFSAKGRSGQRAGAGLGLALVNRFVELHDGWVELESVAGSGTLVRCHLPRRFHEPAPLATDEKNVA